MKRLRDGMTPGGSVKQIMRMKKMDSEKSVKIGRFDSEKKVKKSGFGVAAPPKSNQN